MEIIQNIFYHSLSPKSDCCEFWVTVSQFVTISLAENVKNTQMKTVGMTGNSRSYSISKQFTVVPVNCIKIY